MKLRSWGAAALAACALLTSAPRLHAKQPAVKGGTASAPEATADMGAELATLEQTELAGYNNVDACNTCSTGSCCSGPAGFAGLLCRPIQLVFGAEYIYARANFSDALAYVEQDLATAGETFHCYDFDYGSSYGVYGGVYLPDCGGAMMLNFRQLRSDASGSAASSSTVNVFAPFEADGNIEFDASVDLKTYDLSFAKTIPLGCPLECGCTTNCGDACADTCCDDTCCDRGSNGCGSGCGWCPAWDITWSGGIRYADVSWNRGADSFDPLNDFAFLDGYDTNMSFQGFGGRVGLMGRRYIGKRGLASVYAKGDWSLLMGDVSIETLVTNAAGTAFARKDCEQIIPVTEIELGGSVHLGCRATLSGGYFWSAWHDLGTSESYHFPQFQVQHFDDGNILAFDGLFARVEVAF